VLMPDLLKSRGSFFNKVEEVSCSPSERVGYMGCVIAFKRRAEVSGASLARTSSEPVRANLGGNPKASKL